MKKHPPQTQTGLSAQSSGPIESALAPGSEPAPARGGGLALRAKISTHLTRFIMMDEQGRTQEMMMQEGRMTPISGQERLAEGEQELLFWAPLELSAERLTERLSLALPGWEIKAKRGQECAESAQELLAGGLAKEVMELEAGRACEDASAGSDGESLRALARRALEAELAALCERPPLSREVSWGDAFWAFLFKKAGEPSAEARACLELAAEHERREIEATALTADAGKSRPRL